MSRKSVCKLAIAAVAMAAPIAGWGQQGPKVSGVDAAIVVDSAGKKVGTVMCTDLGCLLTSVMVGVEGKAYMLGVTSGGLGTFQLVMFLEPNCAGTPYMGPPNVGFVQTAGLGLPGQTLYAPTANIMGQIFQVASAYVQPTGLAAPVCVPWPPPPPPGGPPPANQFMLVPAVKVADLSLFFKPPFSVQLKTFSAGN